MSKEVDSILGTSWAWSDPIRADGGHRIEFNPFSFGDPDPWPMHALGVVKEIRPSTCDRCAEHEAWARAQDPLGMDSYKPGPVQGLRVVDVIEGNLKKVELSESQQRKNTPVVTGVLDYFPDAIKAIARISKFGNDKHNPGEPLHWSRGKSNDHADCVGRHLIDRGKIDPETGESHTVEMAWRALALLQIEEEERLGITAQK